MSLQVIILDSARGSRHLDATASRPRSLEPVVDAPVLEWINQALKSNGLADIVYVGGYHIEKVVQGFPALRYRYHEAWQEEGELSALLQASSLLDEGCLVLRGSTLMMPDAVERLINAEGEVIYGTYQRSGESVFAGAMLLRPSTIEHVLQTCSALCSADPSSQLDDLLASFAAGVGVDLDGVAAPSLDRNATRRAIFRGKARTLEQLACLARSALILEQVRFSVEAWCADTCSILEEVRRLFGEGLLIVRSSATSEDTAHSSGAGRFYSQLGVPAADMQAITGAVESVIDSYKHNGREIDVSDEILIQPQVENLTMSGVVLTRDVQTGAPYFVLNYESGSGRSDVITSGADGNVETYYVAWNSPDDILPAKLSKVVRLARELIDLTHDDSLDIEFGEGREGQLYLFQVRPLPSSAGKMGLVANDHLDFVERAEKFVSECTKPNSWTLGHTTIFGNMPDWNPAEIIGTAPRPLALSLYQYLIGEHNWARARAKIGYRDIEPVPLIVSIGGRPYVDVRASLNSFLPATLDENIGEKWVNYCIDLLKSTPSLHDKVEFEVAITCLGPDWHQSKERLVQAGLSKNEIKHFRNALRILTHEIVNEQHASFQFLENCLGQLNDRRSRYQTHPDDDLHALALKARMHLKDCERYGVLPFAIFARYGFVAMSLLRGIVQCGILDSNEYETVLRAIPTVAGDFVVDVDAYNNGNLELDSLLDRYGHLRPHSYEITVQNYSQAPDVFLGVGDGRNRRNGTNDTPPFEEAMAIFTAHASEIDAVMDEFGLGIRHAQLLEFVRRSITGREHAKFQFMKNLDAFLELTASMGVVVGLNRDELSYLEVPQILELSVRSLSSASVSRLRRSAGYCRKRMELTAAFRLPDVISEPQKVRAFAIEKGRPNFITRKRIVAPIAFLEGADGSIDLAGKIVLIRAADPGFDWVFAHPIAGLVTEYGGVASHMAIRAAEFGLPAAIGCGRAAFEKFIHARSVDLDCGNHKVQVAQ